MYVCECKYVSIDVYMCVCGGVEWVGKYEGMYVCFYVCECT